MRSAIGDFPDVAELLFARARFAESVLDASLDYEKIIAEFISSPRREESLLRLAQRALIAGDAAKAREYLRIMSRDYPGDSSQAAAGYWTARALIDSHEVSSACEANHRALAHARASATPLLRDIETQARVSCAQTATISIPDSQRRSVQPAATTLSRANPAISRHFAVQVSAFAKRVDAEGMAQRLRKSGLDAHVDGTIKPFRVRIGHYTSYAQAEKARREMKSHQLAGFVTELDQ